MKNSIVVENHDENTLSVMPDEKYREISKGCEWRYEPISDADTEDEALKIIEHINEVGGVLNYFTELMDKNDFHKVTTKERTVVSIVDKFRNGYVWVVQLHTLYKIMDERDSLPEDAVMVTLKQNVKLKKVTKKDLLKWVLTYYEKGEKCKLIVKKDRYNGKYSGAKYLAFKQQPSFVATLEFNGTPEESETFWKEDVRYYDIGKGDTPKEAVKNLKKLYKQEKQIARREFIFDKLDDVVNHFKKNVMRRG